MSSAPAVEHAFSFVKLWRRLAVAFAISLGVALLLRTVWTSLLPLLLRTMTIAVVATVVFTIFEQWPRHLPRWCPRWVLQVVSVGVSIPVSTLSIYLLTTDEGALPFWKVPDRMNGFMMLTFFGLLLAPWTALAALLRQREAFAQHQALAFELERSELERQAIDARFHLLQAQVAPHFLFNTLANVQALVDGGSPRASAVLRSLTAYLRAAVPQLDEASTTLDRELQLVRAYLELMHMRMPDRLQFDLHVDGSLLTAQCPPTTLLTLVENAVRHGIDPSEEGGRIDIHVDRKSDRCIIRVLDTGIGLGETSRGLGTGLTALRERLDLFFDRAAELSVTQRETGGVHAEVSFPVDEVK